MNTTQYLAAQLKPLYAKLEAIRKGTDPKLIAKQSKPLQKRVDKIEAMKRAQRKFKGEK